MTKLSIITINRNNADGLRKTIESVVSQTFTDFEYIIIDGASTDGSVEIIKEYADRITYWVSEVDNGIFNAMNKGILKATGEYLLFLNSGDWLMDKDVIFDFMGNKFNASVVSGNIYLWQNDNAIFRKSYSVEEIHYGNFYRGSLPHAATFIKKNLFEKYGLYTERYKIVSDWEFFFKVLIVFGCDYTYFDRVISYFDLKGISNADETRSLQNEERLDVLQSVQPLFYKSYKLLMDKYDSLLLHEPEYQEYKNLKNGKFSFVIKLILMLKKMKVLTNWRL